MPKVRNGLTGNVDVKWANIVSIVMYRLCSVRTIQTHIYIIEIPKVTTIARSGNLWKKNKLGFITMNGEVGGGGYSK